MKRNRFTKIAATIFVALTIVVSGAYAQGNAILNGTVDNTGGTIKVKAALSGSVTNIAGTVEFNANGAQTIPSGYTFENLTGSTGGTKSLGGNVIVTSTLTADAVTVAVGSNQLTVGGATPIDTTAGGIVTASSGTVIYNRDGNQTIFGTTYANLTTSGATVARTKTAGGNVTVTGTITNGDSTTIDFGSNTFIGTGATFANSAILKSSGTVTVDATETINGKFEYAGNAQAVAPASYTDLMLSGGSHTFSGTTKIAGVYTAGGGARTYAGTFEYNSAVADQSVIGESNYASLVLSGGASKKLADIATISGDLTLAANDSLDMNNKNISLAGNLVLGSNIATGTGVLTMTSTTGTNVTGAYEVIGSVTRTHAFTASTPYAFNNASMIVTPTAVGTLNSFTISSLPSTNPTGYTAGNSVKRTYTSSYAGAGFVADVQLAYLAAEYTGTQATRLKDFQGGIVKANKLSGTYARGNAGGFEYVSLAGLSDGTLTSGSQLALDDRFNVFVSKAIANWGVGTTWDMNSVPTSADDVEIASAFAVTIPTGTTAQANSVLINDGATGGLTLTGTGTLAVGAGGLTNANTTGAGLNVSTSGNSVTITGSDLTNTGKITNAGTITVE